MEKPRLCTSSRNCSQPSSSLTNPPGLIPFIPNKDQKEFFHFLYLQYQFWDKERKRCFYIARRLSKKRSDNIITFPSSSTSIYSTSTSLLLPVLPRAC